MKINETTTPQTPQYKAKVEKLRKVGQDFESMIVSILIKSMRNTIPKNNLFTGGYGEKLFQGLFDQEIATLASKKGKGLGIGEMIFDKYLRYIATEDTNNNSGGP
jgi:Rod binding domain-containing protein